MKKKMHSLYLIPLVFMLSIISLVAQPSIEWQKKYGGSNRDRAYGITLTDDGGYVVVGETLSSDEDVSTNKGNYDVWVIKISVDGDIEWERSYGGSGYDQANSVLDTGDGYLISGYTTSSDGNIGLNLGVTDFWVFKVSTDGAIEWEKCFGTPGDDFGRAMIMTEAGDFVVVGSGTKINTSIDREVMAIKFSADGTQLWQRFYGGSGGDHARNIKQTSDGGYIICGSTNSDDGDVTVLHSSTDEWVLKISASGDLEWQKTFGGGTGYHSAYDVMELSDGYFVIGQHGGEDIWVIKIGKAGEFIWQKSFGGSEFDYPATIIKTRDNGYVIAGLSRSSDGDVPENKGLDDLWIMKMDTEGELVWQKTIGGSNYDAATDIKQTSDDGFIISGVSSSSDGDLTEVIGLQDFWVVKLNAAVVSTDVLLVEPGFDLFPNPVTDQLTIKRGTQVSDLGYSITNNLGVKIMNGTFSDADHTIDVSHLIMGTYFIRLASSDNEFRVKTFYKE